MGLTDEKALKEIQTLFDMCFIANAKLDRQVYVLDIKFNQPNFQNWYHNKISHYFPELADKIQEFGSLRSDLFYRGAIDIENKDYVTVSDIMEEFTLYLSKMENQISKAIDVCIEVNDKFYEDFLRDFGFTKLAPLMKQAVVFYNATREYEAHNDIHKWNKDFGSYIIQELKGQDL